MVPIVSSGQEYQPEETESENFQSTAEEPLHETASEIPKEVDEGHVPPVETNLDKGKEPEAQPQVQYSAWDASKSVFRLREMRRVLTLKQSPPTRRLSTRGLEFPSDAL